MGCASEVVSWSWEALLPMVLLGAWSAVLINRGIATFHDGLRPVVAEWVAGRVGRHEVRQVARAISPGFLSGSTTASAAIGIAMTGMLLIATDLIGSMTANTIVAAAGGGLWAALVVGILQGLAAASAALPVPVLETVRAMALPLVFIVSLVPAVAAGYQLGPRSGVITALVSLACGFVIVGRFVPSIGAQAATLLVGLVILIGWAIVCDRRGSASRVAPADDELIALWAANAARVRQNVVALMIQGALLGVVIRGQTFGWMLADALASATGHLVDAAAFALLLVAAFLPLLTTGTLASGVTQTIGLGLVFPIAYLAPNLIVAAAAGAASMAVEVRLLSTINCYLDRYPTVRESADSLRTALDKVVSVAILAGAMIAGGAMLPGGLGYALVAGAVVLNEIAGRTFGGSVSLLAAIAVGLLANVLVVLGIRITL